MARFVFDIESTGLTNADMIDYTSGLPVFKDCFEIHCIVAQDIDTGAIYAFYDKFEEDILVVDDVSGQKVSYKRFPLRSFERVLNSTDTLIGHNILNYDLYVLKLLWGLHYTVGESVGISDTLNGRECLLEDTLVLSKLLNPDRYGGHSLDSFGKRLKFNKGCFGKQENAWEVFTPEMLAYCIQDVRLNTKVFEYLEKERRGWDWSDAYCLEKAVKELITRSEQVGFFFDRELAEWCVEDLNIKLETSKNIVEPELPLRELPKGQQPTFPAKPFTQDGSVSSDGWRWLKDKLGYTVNEEALTFKPPPKVSFKKDGSISKSGEKYCTDNGVIDPDQFKGFISGCIERGLELKPLSEDNLEKALGDLRRKKMPNVMVPMTLSDQRDLKEHIISMGWIPMEWSENDLTLDKKTKKRVDRITYVKRVERYLKDSEGSRFYKFRCEYLETTDLRAKLLKHNQERPMRVYGSPKFTVGLSKEIDPNLEKLGDKVAWIESVVLWLTYRHRRNAIHSPPNANKKHWSGWLANKRVQQDSRIPTPADTCGAATGRFLHIDVANIPRPSSIYGEYMRRLFGVDKKHVQIGMDFDSLEAKIESHFCWNHDPNKEYCEALVAIKPNDIHTMTAKKIGTDRDTAKSSKYCLAYGGQPPTLAKTINKSVSEATQIFDLYWIAAKPLKTVKDLFTEKWKKTGKKYIIGLDGRKLHVRSAHSIVNLLFQNAGVTAAKRAAIWWDRHIVKEGITSAEMIIMYHDEQQTQDLISNVEFFMFKDKGECEVFRDKWELDNNKLLSDVGIARDGRFFVGYCRSGELAALSCKHASDYYNLNIDLSGGYMLGKNWKDCH